MLLLVLPLCVRLAYTQLSGVKSCYTQEGGSTADFPCNPEADVSACCGAGWKCRTNLFCESDGGVGVVGTCTDRRWVDSNNPACPFPLNTGHYTTNYDHFGYKLNTTICDDATVCPNNFFSMSNDTCCDNHKGIQEINYHNDAALPRAASDLPDYYSYAGYTIPTDGVYKTATYSSYTATTRSTIANPAAATASPTPTTPPTVAAPTSTPTPSPGLSSGAKAGIGIGAALGVSAIVGLAALFWTRRRKRLQKTGTDENAGAQPPPQYNNEYFNGLKMEQTTAARMYGYKGELPADVEQPQRQELLASERHTHEMSA